MPPISKILKTKTDITLNRDSASGEAELKKLAVSAPIVRIVDTIIKYALFEGAGDIHIEPDEKNILARYRVDGSLRTAATLPKKFHPGIAARIKMLAGLKVPERFLPQDGRFAINANGNKAVFNISIIPALEGEKIILKPAKITAKVLTLSQLGFQPLALEIIKKNILKPRGLILATGPNSSGKTATLYAILNALNTPRANLLTIEDPIECRLAHVNQSQVNAKAGYTFAVGLRAFLKQDPNLIMVGEINGLEAVLAALRAASGRPVISAMDGNDAADALAGLNGLGVPLFLTASSLNAVIAQKLVKKICPDCIQSYKLDRQTIRELRQRFDLKIILETLRKYKIISGAGSNMETLKFYRGKGCRHCSGAGYRGNIGIFEVLEITPEIKELILKNASVWEIKKQAKKQGLITMAEDGFIKAKNGITTIEEIMRVFEN